MNFMIITNCYDVILRFRAATVGKAIVRFYKEQGIQTGKWQLFPDLQTSALPGPQIKPIALSSYEECKSTFRIPELQNMDPGTINELSKVSDLRRVLIAEIVTGGEILRSEYLPGRNRRAYQMVSYKGAVFSFSVGCGRLQYEKTDPEDIYRLGIPQYLRMIC